MASRARPVVEALVQRAGSLRARTSSTPPAAPATRRYSSPLKRGDDVAPMVVGRPPPPGGRPNEAGGTLNGAHSRWPVGGAGFRNRGRGVCSCIVPVVARRCWAAAADRLAPNGTGPGRRTEGPGLLDRGRPERAGRGAGEALRHGRQHDDVADSRHGRFPGCWTCLRLRCSQTTGNALRSGLLTVTRPRAADPAPARRRAR
jgi:hypothetical protein